MTRQLRLSSEDLSHIPELWVVAIAIRYVSLLGAAVLGVAGVVLYVVGFNPGVYLELPFPVPSWTLLVVAVPALLLAAVLLRGAVQKTEIHQLRNALHGRSTLPGTVEASREKSSHEHEGMMDRDPSPEPTLDQQAAGHASPGTLGNLGSPGSPVSEEPPQWAASFGEERHSARVQPDAGDGLDDGGLSANVLRGHRLDLAAMIPTGKDLLLIAAAIGIVMFIAGDLETDAQVLCVTLVACGVLAKRVRRGVRRRPRRREHDTAQAAPAQTRRSR